MIVVTLLFILKDETTTGHGDDPLANAPVTPWRKPIRSMTAVNI